MRLAGFRTRCGKWARNRKLKAILSKAASARRWRNRVGIMSALRLPMIQRLRPRRPLTSENDVPGADRMPLCPLRKSMCGNVR